MRQLSPRAFGTPATTHPAPGRKRGGWLTMEIAVHPSLPSHSSSSPAAHGGVRRIRQRPGDGASSPRSRTTPKHESLTRMTSPARRTTPRPWASSRARA
eukprot:7961462-Alexandrium_andersonii.AAC.1